MKTFTNLTRRPLGSTTTKTVKHMCDIKPHFYQRPCIINPEPYDDFDCNGRRKQRPVCHARDFPRKK